MVICHALSGSVSLIYLCCERFSKESFDFKFILNLLSQDSYNNIMCGDVLGQDRNQKGFSVMAETCGGYYGVDSAIEDKGISLTFAEITVLRYSSLILAASA